MCIDQLVSSTVGLDSWGSLRIRPIASFEKLVGLRIAFLAFAPGDQTAVVVSLAKRKEEQEREKEEGEGECRSL